MPHGGARVASLVTPRSGRTALHHLKALEAVHRLAASGVDPGMEWIDPSASTSSPLTGGARPVSLERRPNMQARPRERRRSEPANDIRQGTPLATQRNRTKPYIRGAESGL